ncbi:MAG: hypothetical protein ACHQ9S_21445 [Candidatus Binatia bacterium]
MACFTALALAACGSQGTSSIYIPPQNTPVISGTLYAPNGQFAAADHWWRWADAFGLLPRAYALQGVVPVTSVQNVSLSRLDPVEAAHGSTDRAYLIANASTDPKTGMYMVVTDAAGNLDADRMIVQVGSGNLLTRAFVFSPTTNIDAASEALVRLVLNRLTQAPPVQLDTFSSDGLMYIDVRTRAVAQAVSGNSVAEINDNTYATLAGSGTVLDAIDCATGVQAKCM